MYQKSREEELAWREHFGRLYSAWLSARAAHHDPDAGDDEVEVGKRAAAADEAGRQLLVTPASIDWMVWRKWEVLDYYVSNDAIDGQHADNRAVMALGCLKADLARLGIGREREQ